MLVIFSHGKEGSPNGTKSQIIKAVTESLNHTYLSVDYSECTDVNDRIKMLKTILRKIERDVVLVGSSMGGYVSSVISNEIETEGLFLIAPALYINEREYSVKSFQSLSKNIWVRHGWEDDIIPVENSLKFSKQHKCKIVIEKDNHRMSETKLNLARDIKQFLKQCQDNIKGKNAI